MEERAGSRTTRAIQGGRTASNAFASHGNTAASRYRRVDPTGSMALSPGAISSGISGGGGTGAVRGCTTRKSAVLGTKAVETQGKGIVAPDTLG